MIDGEVTPVELHHDQVAGGHVDRMDLALPVTVGPLLADDAIVEPIAKRLPLLNRDPYW